MNFLIGLIIGFILGWLINWFFQRRSEAELVKKLETADVEKRQLKIKVANSQHLAEKLSAAEVDLDNLQAQAAEIQQTREKLEAAEAEIDYLRNRLAQDEQQLERLATAEAEIRDLRAELVNTQTVQHKLATAELTIEQLQTKLAAISGHVTQPKDQLEMIHGVGSVFARRLNNAGVNTFADLAQLTPSRIREIVAVKEWQKIDPNSWINQAKDFAGLR